MKFIIGLMLCLISSFVLAKSTTPSVETKGSIVTFSQNDRVIIYTSERNSVTSDGLLLVCPNIFIAQYNGRTCLNANGRNAWSLLSNSLPGFTPTGYEIRMWTYNQVLIVYYSPN